MDDKAAARLWLKHLEPHLAEWRKIDDPLMKAYLWRWECLRHADAGNLTQIASELGEIGEWLFGPLPKELDSEHLYLAHDVLREAGYSAQDNAEVIAEATKQPTAKFAGTPEERMKARAMQAQGKSYREITDEICKCGGRHKDAAYDSHTEQLKKRMQREQKIIKKYPFPQ